MNQRSRVTIFLGGVVLFTGLVQWDGLAGFLNSGVGVDWSSGLIAFFQKNTQGLIILVLLGLFLEWSGIRQSREEQRQEFETTYRIIEHALNTSTPKALIEHSLNSLYGPDAARQLAQNVFSETSIIRDVAIEIKVREDEHGDFVVEVEFSYRTESSRFIAAVAQDPSCLEAVLATGVVSEGFIVQNEGEAVPASVQRIDRDPQTDVKRIHDLHFVESKGRKKQALFRGLELQVALDKVKIYEGRVESGRKKAPPQEYVFRISYSDKQSKELPYTYWMNDRIAHIKSIEVDLRALGAAVFRKAKVHRFLASSQWPAEINLESGRTLIPLDTWSVAGDGIVVVWSGRTNIGSKGA